MPNSSGAQTIDADPKQTVTVVDSEESGSQSQEKPGKQSITRGKRILVISAAMLVAAAAGYFAWNAFRYEDTDDAQVDGHVMPLSARINGNIEQVLVMEGQLVHAGDVLVTIDPQDYKIASVQAQANLADAQATSASLHWSVPITSVTVRSNLDSAKTAVVNAEAAVRASEQNYESAKAALVQAEANATKSDADLERAKELVAKEDISRLQYDQAVASAQAAAATLQAARASADAFAAQIRQAQSKLQQAGADLRTADTAPQQMRVTQARALSAKANADQKKAQLDQAELNLQYTKVIAPVNGIVSNRTVEVGQNVQPGQEMMKVIPVDDGDLWVTANFKETQLRNIRPGQAADITVDANGKTYKGKVDSIAGASGARFSLLPPENATGNYVKVVQRLPVKIVFNPGEIKGRELRPGMSVTPKVWIK